MMQGLELLTQYNHRLAKLHDCVMEHDLSCFFNQCAVWLHVVDCACFSQPSYFLHEDTLLQMVCIGPCC